MATANQTQNNLFYGGVIKRVFVISPKNQDFACSPNTLELIRTKFNTVRNYKEFCHQQCVEIIQRDSSSLPRINSFREGDACLFIGNGRFIDKAGYEFMKKCFMNNILVYFIRSNSLDCDPRVNGKHIWRVPSLIIKTSTEVITHCAPAMYFMQIPSFGDIILLQNSNEYYALLPGMVPFYI